MIRIETDSGAIMAKAVIAEIPVDPAYPPSMTFIDPHRRWQIEAEKIWMRRPWIVTRPDGYEVYHLGPTWGLLRLSAKSYAKKYFSLTLAPFAEFTFRHELRCTTSLSESLFYIRFTNLRL